MLVKVRRVVAVCAVIGVVATAACASASKVVVTAEDDGGTVSVRPGGEVAVELEGNPTTGYTWLETTVPGMLASQGEPAFEPDSDAIGAGGVMTLTYDVVADGEGTLELEYARAWEDVPPIDTFSVTVVVTP